MKPLFAPLALVAAYLAAGALGLQLATTHGSVTLVWPPTGIAIAALLLGGRALWPAVFLGALLTNLLIGASSAPAALVIAAGNTLEALTAAAALRRLPDWSDTLARPSDLLAFLLVAVAMAPTLAALLGVAGLLLAGDVAWADASVLATQWWLGDAFGALVAAPPVIAWLRRPRRPMPPREAASLALAAVLLAAVSILAWRPDAQLAEGRPVLVFLAFPFIVWTGLRHGLRGATTATAIASSVAIWGTAAASHDHAADLAGHLSSLWMYLAVVGVSGLLAAAGFERHRLADALEASERRYRAVVEGAPFCIHEMDLDARILAMNSAGLAMTGLAPASVICLTLGDIVPPAARAEVLRHFARARAGATATFELTAESRDDGRPRAFAISFVPVRDHAGAVERVIGHVHELTAARDAEREQNQLKEQLLHAQKLESLGVLAGGIAHDFNNLLAVVLGNAELARADIPPGHAADISLDAIEVAAHRAAELCGQMLAYSGRARFELRTLDIAAEARGLAELLRVSLPKSARLELELDPRPITVDADVSQLRQVVMNLVTNAGDAVAERGGTLRLRTGTATYDAATLGRMPYAFRDVAPGEMAWIEVEDDGVGMSAETVARIFDPFYTTKEHGRGLGLAATLGIVRGHKGAIEVASAPGRGSRFRLILPLSRRPATPARSSSRPPTARRDGTVLVVDDEDALRQLARTVLQRAGYRVLCAVDGIEALERFGDGRGVDTVLLDLTMPRLDGHDTLARLTAIRPDLPVILSSGYGEQEVRADEGALFLRKPWRAADLLSLVGRAIRRAREAQGLPTDPDDAAPGDAIGAPRAQ